MVLLQHERNRREEPNPLQSMQRVGRPESTGNSSAKKGEAAPELGFYHHRADHAEVVVKRALIIVRAGLLEGDPEARKIQRILR